jgi:hypothetical protein
MGKALDRLPVDFEEPREPRRQASDLHNDAHHTLAVADLHGRDAIGIDIDARNADLAVERVGMLLTVEEVV